MRNFSMVQYLEEKVQNLGQIAKGLIRHFTQAIHALSTMNYSSALSLILLGLIILLDTNQIFFGFKSWLDQAGFV